MAPHRYNRCIVPGCEDKKSFKHWFPRKSWGPEVFLTWLIRINSPILKYKTKQEVIKRALVCDRHFDESCKIPGSNKLIYGSAPTLYLPNYPTDPSLSLKEIWPVGYCEEIDLAEPETGSSRQMVNDDDLMVNQGSFPPDIIEKILAAQIYTSPPNEENSDTQILNENKEEDQVIEQVGDVPHQKPNELEIIDATDKQNIEKVRTYTRHHEKSIAPEIVESTTNSPEFEKPCYDSLASLLYGNKIVTAVCRICLCAITREELDQIQTTSHQVADLVKFVLPDLDVEKYSDNSYCTKCLELLIYSYKLKETWLAAEKRLQKAIEDREIQEEKRKIEEEKRRIEELNRQEAVRQVPERSTERINCISEEYSREEDNNDFLRDPWTDKYNIDSLFWRISAQRVRQLKYGPGPFQCERCGEVFVNLAIFRKHLFRHERRLRPKKEKQKLMCEICGREFYSTFYLNAHIKKHIEDPEPESYECIKCKKVFNKKAALATHVRNVHMKKYDHYQCHICGVRLSARSSLRSHMMRHRNERREECKVCYKRFYFRTSLKKHQASHSKEKPLTCPFCGKSIKYAVSLKNHIRVFHMDGGKHVCGICKKPYMNKMNLNYHKIRVHGSIFRNEDVVTEATNSES